MLYVVIFRAAKVFKMAEIQDGRQIIRKLLFSWCSSLLHTYELFFEKTKLNMSLKCRDYTRSDTHSNLLCLYDDLRISNLRYTAKMCYQIRNIV